ncbi:MAG: UDP-N-acetylmuramoyl-L-alanine--D-glutamate ligase [Candidatus Sungbacteria bacterium]|nr:UDP-N-acetylmuramoyl-L-alanine--D-glutamate ligase [Candidatus Sungbacteria bacterium]
MDDLKKVFRNKKVLILGLGLHGGGVGAASFFAKAGAKVLVADLKSRKELASSLAALRRYESISYVLGRHRRKDIVAADLIIKNPGVPDNSPWLVLARVNKIPVASDIEFFFSYCPAKIIGVTGTKGKSTTASLLAEFLRAGTKKRVWLAGNIRKSVFEILPQIRSDDHVVLELSSFQLDSLANSRMSPHIAVITNIFPDHLNRYKSFKHYAGSKMNIFRYQKKKDLIFIPRGDVFLEKITRGAVSRRVPVDVEKALRPYSSIIGKRFFSHQIPSVALAVAVSRRFGVSELIIRKVLGRFRQLPGRLERVRVLSGVTFVNDTTATNPGSATAALRVLRERNGGGIVLIAGGSDKKLPVKDFAIAICKFAKAVVFLPGEATQKMNLEIRNPVYAKATAGKQKSKIIVREAKTMKEAVAKAYALAEKRDTVLLSPGAASFGLFRNEFDRGDQFVKAVMRLAPKK